MRADLPVDQLEAPPSVGDLLTEAGGEFGEQVAVLAGGGLGVEMQLGDVAGQQRMPFGVERGDVAPGVTDLAADAEQLGGSAFAGNGGVDLAVVVEQALQRLRVAAAVGLVGASHQQGEVPALGVVAREVGMDALGDVAEEGLEAGRRIELLSFAGLAEGSVVCLLRALASLLGAATSGVGVVEIDLAFSDPRFDLVQLGVEDADLAKVAALEGLELGANLRQLRFSLSQLGTNGGKLLALGEERSGVRGLLDDLG